MAKLDLDNLFSYHAPKGDQVQRYAEIREAAQTFAQVIVDLTPESAEQTLAIRKVHDAMMQANSAIACNKSFQTPFQTEIERLAASEKQLPYQKREEEHEQNLQAGGEHYKIG